jgi:hypothetical protein
MATQISSIDSFQARTLVTRRRIQLAQRRIRRIENAKTLVVGVVAPDSQSSLRKLLEKVLVEIDEAVKLLVSGALDEMSDEALKTYASLLQDCNAKISAVLDGSVRIGFEAVEPFPALLSQLREKQGQLQSQIEGILLSLNDSFQDLISKSAKEIRPTSAER